MDYDENDFQSQNLHLAGEGSSKFSPVLRPYALPKFDFDDSLQGHLRFDNLVETEVFLGIESNTDNQWIEDFSQGNSGIEFDSSAADCTISRRNNVWSEAASTESVEMLLKAVGQEEIIPEQTKESDACDELGCLKMQMEPRPTLLSDEMPENLSGLKEAGEERPHVEDTSQTHKGHSADEIPNDLNPNAVGETCGLHVTDPIVDESVDIRILEDSSTSFMQVDNMVSYVHNTVTSSGKLSNQESQNMINDNINESKDVLQTESGKGGDKLPLRSEGIHVDDINLDRNAVESGGTSNPKDASCLISKVESVTDGNAYNTSISNVEESSSMIVKGDSESQIVEACKKDISSILSLEPKNFEDSCLLKPTKIEDQSTILTYKEPLTVFKDDICFEGDEVDASNTDGGVGASLELKMDSPLQIVYEKNTFVDKKELFVGGHQSEAEVLDSNSEAPLFIGEERKVSEGEFDRNNCVVGDTSLTMVSSSDALPMVTESVKGVNDGVGVCRGDLNAEDHISSSTLVKSTQGCEENRVSRHGDVHNCDPNVFVNDLDKEKSTDHGHNNVGEISTYMVDKEVGLSSLGGSSTELGATKFSTDPSNEDCNIGGSDMIHNGDGSASSFCTENEMKLLKLQSVVTSGNELGVALENANVTSCGTMTIINLHTADENQKEIEKSQLHLSGLSHLDGKEKIATEISKEASSSTMACFQGEESQGQIQAAITDQMCKEGSKELEECRVLCESTVKDGGGAEAVALEKYKEATTKNDTEKALLKVSVTDGSNSSVSDKASCGAATAIKTTLVSQGKTGKEGLKGSSNSNVPPSELADSNASKSGSVLQNLKGDVAPKDDKSFTFEISSPVTILSDRDKSRSIQPVSSTPPSIVSPIIVGSSSNSGSGQVDSKIAHDLSPINSQASSREILPSGSKNSSERKPRRASAKATGKETAKKGKRVTEAAPKRQIEKGNKPSDVSASPSGIRQLVQSNLMQQYGHAECGITKPCSVLTSTSALPDLNSSISSSALFQQPFSDLQQVQLRAQIFVYGSLIQAVAPDEAYMISAFGGPDGGRSIWENVWRASVERSNGQKSNPINPETPKQSRSGIRAPDQAIKHGELTSKVASSPGGRGNNKGTPSTIVTPILPLSSPVWSIPTPSSDALQSTGMSRVAVMDFQQALSPLHFYQNPIRNFGHNTSWISQASLRGPWASSSSQTSSLDANTRLSVLPFTEPVHLVPVREQHVPHSSAIKHASIGPTVHSGGSTSVLVGTAPIPDMKKVTVSPGQNSADPKPRKRKKTPNTEDLGLIMSQSQTEPVLTPAAANRLSASVATVSPGFMSKTSAEEFALSVSPTPSRNHLKRGEEASEHISIFSGETLGKVAEARKQAEDAAALAAATLRHREEVWNQLVSQQSSGLMTDAEAKLASAAVAIAAAASVAKAAAAAANVASSAALQAKLMADEALSSSGYVYNGQSNAISLSNNVNVLGEAIPESALTEGIGGTSSSSSVLISTGEAARKMVHAASAASKRAENLNALVKAAELAAEAISHAGKIVSMSDPMPLSELVGRGPDNYWKVPQVSFEQVAKSNGMNREELRLDGAGERSYITSKQSKDGALDEKGTRISTHGKSPTPRERTGELGMEGHVRNDNNNSIMATEKDSRGRKGHRISDFAKTISMVPESEIGSRSTSEDVHDKYQKVVETLKENGMKEGSHVEVYKDGNGLKAAWFSANVLSLKDGKAYVGYNDLLDGGSMPLKEWVALEGEADKAPIIRIARPTTRFEGTRKRRREAMGDYKWSIGDRVDALIQESWREGVVTEKNMKDETMLTVHFPVQGETSVVRAWDLRPSLIWKDGDWIVWSREGENIRVFHEGDTPQEKRLKLGTSLMETKGKDKMPKGIGENVSEKPSDVRLLDLSENEKVFNIGKSTRDENKPDAHRMVRSGLQKQGSRVIFGVPKPGKKRKFMDVSKHYVTNQRSKNNDEANDLSKLAKYSMPQGPGLRGWKYNGRNDLKEKQRVEAKPKVLRSGKMQSDSVRTITQKDSFSTSSVSAPSDGTVIDHITKSKNSDTLTENASGKQNTKEFGSFASNEGTSEGPNLFSSLPHPLSKKVPTSNAKSERANKGSLAPAGGRLAKINEEKVLNGNPAKSSSEVQPRRSVRRIQPTSRLLEGLQSSLIVSKIPFSHDKSHKSQNRNVTKGNN